MKRTEQDIINNIIEIFENNESLFADCIEELDSWNGCLGDGRIENMDYLDEYFTDSTPLDILYKAYYGYDADTYTTDEYGDRHYREFNPHCKYYYFNGYGNLVSTNCREYSDRLNEDTVREMHENRRYVYSIEDDDDLSALFDQWDNIDEDNED